MRPDSTDFAVDSPAVQTLRAPVRWGHSMEKGQEMHYQTYLSKTKVLGLVRDDGPTSIRSLSPGWPSSTGHGV